MPGEPKQVPNGNTWVRTRQAQPVVQTVARNALRSCVKKCPGFIAPQQISKWIRKLNWTSLGILCFLTWQFLNWIPDSNKQLNNTKPVWLSNWFPSLDETWPNVGARRLLTRIARRSPERIALPCYNISVLYLCNNILYTILSMLWHTMIYHML